jgi:hypothetical protein
LVCSWRVLLYTHLLTIRTMCQRHIPPARSGMHLSTIILLPSGLNVYGGTSYFRRRENPKKGLAQIPMLTRNMGIQARCALWRTVCTHLGRYSHITPSFSPGPALLAAFLQASLRQHRGCWHESCFSTLMTPDVVLC